MRVERPRKHDQIVEGLWRAARERGLPHAFTFEGTAGTGRFQAAQWFAAGLLCETGPGVPCGTCRGCRKTASGGWRSNHADLFIVDEPQHGDDLIRLGRIAYRPDDSKPVPNPEDCMERFFPFRPLEGERRVALVREAHRMNVAAQNALLKTLEEPPDGTVLVLETDRAGELLDTILSRCVRLHFAPLEPVDTAEILREIGPEAGLDADATEFLARWSGGSPGEALRLQATAAAEMRALIIEATGSKVGAARGVAIALWELDVEFGGSTEARRQRQRARVFLDLALAVLRDLLRLAAGEAPESVRHGDLPQELHRISTAALTACIEELLLARRDVDANLAPDAVVERATRALADLSPARAVAAHGSH